MKTRKTLRLLSVLLILSMVLLTPLQAIALGIEQVSETVTQASDPQPSSDGVADIIAELTQKRTADTKHFLLSDGTMMAVQYDTPVHFDAEAGWEQYDNSMSIVDDTVSDDEKEYVNKKSNQTVKLAKKAKENKTVTYAYGNYKIAWGYADSNKAELEFINNTSEKTGNDRFLVLDSVTQQAKYPDIFSDVDLELFVSSTGIKENLILNSASAQNEFVIEYKLKNLTAEQKDGKTVVLENSDGEEVYVLSAPEMYDSAGARSAALSLEITEQKNGKLTLRLAADSEWLQANERVYPVTVDPHYIIGGGLFGEDGTLSSTVRTATAIHSAYNYKNISISDPYVGSSHAYGITEAVVYFSYLPYMTEGDTVSKAQLSMYNISPSSTYLDIYASAVDITLPSGVKNGTSNVILTDYTNYSHSSTKLDYAEGGGEGYVTTWDITTLVRQWMSGAVENNGVALWAPSGTTTGTYAIFNGATSDTSSLRPTLCLYYYNAMGLEDYWTYHSESIGHGALHLNDSNGNLVYSLPLFSATGARNPASLGLVYNSAVYNEIYSGTAVRTYAGYGWQSTLDMHVYDMRTLTGWDTTSVGGWGYTMFSTSTESLPNIMALGDSDGTLHYFYYDDTDNVYKDENGSGSTLTTSATVGREYVLADRSGYKYYFDIFGSLVAYEDINGNTVTITTSTTYTNITDAAGRVYRINRVSNVDNRYSSIVLPDGDTITFSYTNTSYLSSVSYPDGTSTSFAYSDGALSQITANDGSKVTLQYETSAFSRYSSYKRCTAVNGLSPSGTSTGSLAVSYSPGLTTTFTSTTSLGSVVNTYTFDTYGRTITVYNETEGYCSNYDYTSNTTSNPDKNNKVTNVQPGGEIAKNLLGVESGKTAFDGWEFINLDKFQGAGAVVTHGNTSDIGNGVDIAPYGYGWYAYAKRVPISSSVSHYTFSVRGKGPGEYGFGIGQFGIYIAYESGSNIYLDSSAVCEADEYSSDWQNLSCTIYNDLYTAVWVIIGINGYEGSFCFESPQLEEGSAANDYNLLSPDFYDWDSSGYYDFDANFGDYVELSGNKDQWISYSYTVPVSSTGKQYEFTAHLWTFQTQIAEHEFDRWYQITISGRGSSGSSSVIKSESINPYVTGDQMLSVSCAPTGAIDSITVKIEISMLDAVVMIYDCALRVNESGTNYTYDDDGNLVTDENAKGNGSTSTYNQKNQPLTVSTVSGDYSRYYYDSTGYNVTEMFVEIDTASGTGKLGTFYTYNNYGSVTETVLAPVDGDSVSDSGITADGTAHIRSSQTYDATGNYVVSTTDAAGNTTVNNITSSNGRLNSVTDALNNTVSYSYNNLDLLTRVSSGSAGVSYGYDSLNRLVEVYSGTAVYFFDYDSEGRNYRTSVGSEIYHPTLSETTFVSGTSLPSTVTYGNGAVVRYFYDSYGRVTSKYFGTGYNDYVSYIYNNNGQTARVTERRNNAWYYYDYTYDTSGRLVRSATPGLTKQLKYDIFDRITGLDFLLGDARYSYAFTYGKNNAVKTETLEDAYTLSYVYDSLGRVTSKTVDPVAYYDEADLDWHDVSGSYLYSYKPGYNSNGGTGATTTLVSQLVTPFTNTAFNYTYDANGNITAENGKQYYYDSLGQLIKTVEGTTVTEYSYSSGGNIQSRTVTEDGVVVKTDSYVYSGAADWYDQLYSYNGETISYDQIGNPVSYRGATLTWTRGRQLASYYKDVDSVTYTYNSEGIRTEKLVNGNRKTEYILDGSTVIGERTTNAITGESISAIDYFYDSNGEAVGLKYLGKVYMYEKNLQGDVLNVISPMGQTVVSYSYDEWGRLLSVTGSMATTLGLVNSLRYRGYVYDTETGLYYLNSRYYDPEVTRFINGDGVLDDRGLNTYNLYTYCANNPVLRTDNGGQFWDTVFDVISLAFSVVDVVANPDDAMAWVGLAGDVVDLIPFVTCVGEAVKAVRLVDKAVDTVDTVHDTVKIAKAVDFTDAAADIVKTLDRSSGFTKSTRDLGQKIHKGYKASPNFNKSCKEYREIKGIRPDYVDFDNNVIYELKPMNPRGIKSGIKQLQKYNKAMGGGYTLILELY